MAAVSRATALARTTVQRGMDDVLEGGRLDRLLHRSVVLNIDGDSYRMRAHQARAEHLRKGVVVRSGG